MYLFFVYLLHPSLALIAASGAIVLIFLTLLTEHRSGAPLKAATAAGGQRMVLAEQSRRNAEAIQAMGLSGHLGGRYDVINAEYLAQQVKAADAAGGIGNVTKVIRMVLQSAVLGFGAYLVIKQEMSPGAIIAASITVSRALAPIETAIAHWKGFISARLATRRINELITIVGEVERMSSSFPRPRASCRSRILSSARPAFPKRSSRTSRSRWSAPMRSAVSGLRARANRPWRAHSSAFGVR